MTKTIYDDAVEIQGSDPNEKQLRVKGADGQAEPLQTWEDHSGSTLLQVTEDGLLKARDVDLGTPNALVEANNDITLPSSPEPLQGIQARGRISGAISNAIAWLVGELELLGSGEVSGIHTALRGRVFHKNTEGDASNAELRAGDFEAVNEGGSLQIPVNKMTGLRSTVRNTENAYLDKAVGIEIALEDDVGSGDIQTAYGLKIGNVDRGSQDNYAIYTGAGTVHLGDELQLSLLGSTPTENPPADFIKLYPKLDGSIPRLYAKDEAGSEHVLGNPIAVQEEDGTPLVADVTAIRVPNGTLTDNGDNSVSLDYAALSHSHTISQITDLWLPTHIAGGRLSVVSADPRPNLNNNSSTLYYIPYKGNYISLKNSSGVWVAKQFTQKSIAMPVNGAWTMYDVFAYIDGNGDVALELSAWSTWNSRTPATDLAFDSGVLVKSGDSTRRFLGIIFKDSANVVRDEPKDRCIWNENNAEPIVAYNADYIGSSHNIPANTNDWRWWSGSQSTCPYLRYIGHHRAVQVGWQHNAYFPGSGNGAAYLKIIEYLASADLMIHDMYPLSAGDWLRVQGSEAYIPTFGYNFLVMYEKNDNTSAAATFAQARLSVLMEC